MDANDRRQTASEQAAAWFVLLRSQAATPSEREDFVKWLRESALHVAEMLRVMRVHSALAAFEGWDLVSRSGAAVPDNVVSLPTAIDPSRSPYREEPGHSRSEQRPQGSTLRRRLQIGAIAASVGALLIVGLSFFANSSGKLIQTERGERREVTLTDGSLLEIAPESRLRVRFGSQARNVSLERGRAVFRVARNPNRPFSVFASGATIRAVGTAFGVERGENGVRVTVAEGKVAVLGPGVEDASAAQNSGSTPERVATLTPSRLLLKAGEQVLVGAAGIEPVRAVDSNRELAWARGRLVFDNETMLRAVATFNRYNRVQMRVINAELAERAVSGVFDASDPESFIAFIQTDAQVRVVRRDASEIIISKLD